MKQLLICAWRDLLHEFSSTACQIIVIVAILSPLLIQFGLVNGVVSGWITELENNPQTLRIRPTRSINLDAAAVNQLRTRQDVKFVAPTTRDIAAIIEIADDDDNPYPAWSSIGIDPSAPGDPLSATGSSLAPSVDQLSLTQKAADQLGISVGDPLRVLVTRVRNEVEEEHRLRMTIAEVVPNHLVNSRRAYVHEDFLFAVERYKDNYAIPLFDKPGDEPWRDLARFAGVRLYAADIYAVGALADHAQKLFGVDVTTDAAKIHAILKLSANLRTIFLVLTVVAALGLVGALLASMSANIERKRRPLAILALLGYTPRWLMSFPVVQAATICTAAMLLVFVVVVAGAHTIEVYFEDQMPPGSRLISLSTWDWVIAFCLAQVLSWIPAFFAGIRAGRIEPSEALRDV